MLKNSHLFSQTFANHTPITPFVVLSSVESTNNYAMAKLHAGMVEHGFAVMALEQTSGRGQRGKTWLSNPGENITLSIALSLQNQASTRFFKFPFIFSASVALACYDFIKDLHVSGISIKWPNDLYIGDRKAGGILIENTYSGGTWNGSVVGIGLNINQVNFPPGAGRPTSISTVTGINYDIVRLGKKLFQAVMARFNSIDDSTMKAYNELLYRRGEATKVKKDNIVFTVIPDHVSDSGELITRGGIEQRFKVGEVEFV